jgi:predicted ATPase/class 3 adenylate cyclase
MSSLPSGTVTFLFTDIERSTESAAALGDERYAEALQTHRDLLRHAFENRGGVEVGTEGDAFFVAFVRAGDAVGAAVDGQRALESYAWPGEARLRVRMGLHTGEALVRTGEYVGHDVHKAKRVCDAGHGGQILLSQTTTDLVARDATLVDLGLHRLKDLGEPERLHQVDEEGLQNDFPPLRSLESFTHSLPPQRSSFVGRENEIAEVRKLLENHRLVTLTGVGGCGKTRLAVQVGAELLDEYPEGVFFVDLAPISDASVIVRAAAGAVGLALGSIGVGPQTASDALLLEHLARRRCLLVIDNCEHLLDDCADLIDRIIARCPDVIVLATSREGLGVEGEQSWRVPSLSVPMRQSEVDASESVSLFKARAREAEPGFDLTPDNIDAVAEICRRLEGIPLAIEFAAARVSHLSPRQIAERLGDMFRLLTGGRRRIQRQQTLQAALDWSHELLEEPERLLLRRLAVFSGSFTLEAAESISSDDRVPENNVVDLLRSLVEKSLVAADHDGGDVRYRLLETVRLYAAEKLREAEESDAFRTRHRDRYVDWVASMPIEDTYFADATIATLDSELDNLRGAFEWSQTQERRDLVASVAGRLYGLWFWAGHWEEGSRWLAYALEDAERLRPDDLAGCLACVYATSMLGGVGLADFADRASELNPDGQTGPSVVVRMSIAVSQSVQAEMDTDEELASSCRRLGDEAVRLSQDLPQIWMAYALFLRAYVELDLRDVAAARQLLERALDACDPTKHRTLALVINSHLTTVCHVTGDAVAASRTARFGRELMRQAEPGAQDLYPPAESLALVGAGDFAMAKERIQAVFDFVQMTGNALVTQQALFEAAAIAVATGDAHRSSRLLAAGRHAAGAAGGALFRSPTNYLLYVHYVQVVREALSADEARRARDEGRAMSLDEAIAYAREGLES